MRILVVLALVSCKASAPEPLRTPTREPRPPDPEAPERRSGPRTPAEEALENARKLSAPVSTHVLTEISGPRATPPDGFYIPFADISADGSRYALIESSRDRCTVRVHATSNRALVYAGDHGCIEAAVLSPDGARLALAGNKQLAIVDVATGKQTKSHAVDAVDARWLHAGIVAKLADRDIVLVDPATGTTRRLGKATTLAANGDHVVTETVVEENAVPPCPPADCFPAPRLAYDRHDLRTGARVPLVPFHELSGRISIAENGAVAIQTLFMLYTWDPGGTPRELIHLGFINGGSPPALSPDGRWYAVSDGSYTLRVYDLGAAAEIAAFHVRDKLWILQFDTHGRLHGWLHAPITLSITQKP